MSVGSINCIDVLSYGLTGPVAKSAGVKKDIRFLKSETYAHYWFLAIQGYLGRNGDSYDRFLIRLRETQTPWMPAPITATEDLNPASSFIIIGYIK